jgi:hypothetical protein
MTTTESYGCDKHGEDAYQGCAMCDLETLRERLHEAELVTASWKREAELNEQAANESSGYAKRLAEADAHGKAQQRWAHEWRDKHDALTAENAALQKRIENCVMELDRRASALRSVSDERDALRKVVKGFLDDYASTDGMYDMKHYAREFHAAMEQSHDK